MAVSIRKSPRVTINALAEYLIASATRRRRIVSDQKQPKSFQVTYYSEAQEAISRFLANGFISERPLDEAIRDLRMLPSGSDWEMTRRQNCIEAIERFRMAGGHFPFSDFNASLGPPSAKKLLVGKVAISVRPEILFFVGTRQGQKSGGCKLYFRKDQALSEDQGRYAATVLHLYLTEVEAPREPCHFSTCVVADVFAGKFFQAPRTFKKRRHDVEAACEEIHRAWAFL